jgi:hypothetical protein
VESIIGESYMLHPARGEVQMGKGDKSGGADGIDHLGAGGHSAAGRIVPQGAAC